MHSATIKYFKTLELIHFQIKIPKGGQAKPRRDECSPPAPLERNPESNNGCYTFEITEVSYSQALTHIHTQYTSADKICLVTSSTVLINCLNVLLEYFWLLLVMMVILVEHDM